MKTLDALVTRARELKSQRVTVAIPEDHEVMLALKEAVHEGICEPILVGNGPEINKVAKSINFDISNLEVIEEESSRSAARKAVELVSSGEADLVMKGNVQTRDLLKAVLDKEIGLRGGRILSHVAILDVPTKDGILLLSDAAMNIAPELEEKVEIVKNAIDVAVNLEINEPKVALMAAVEVVNPDMKATMDAAVIAKMADRGQIQGGIVDGPFALDNAVSVEAAKQKKIDSPVAGQADILITPAIETGNVLYKTITHLTEGKVAGLLAGAKSPVILTSRADPHDSKVYSIAAACVMAANQKG